MVGFVLFHFFRLLCGVFHQSLAVTGAGGDAGKERLNIYGHGCIHLSF